MVLVGKKKNIPKTFVRDLKAAQVHSNLLLSQDLSVLPVSELLQSVFTGQLLTNALNELTVACLLLLNMEFTVLNSLYPHSPLQPLNTAF